MSEPKLLTVQQVCLLPSQNFASGVRGTIINLDSRVSTRTGKTFYCATLSDSTGQIGVTFFRDDIDGLEGREITLTSDDDARGIRCDRHKHTNAPEITVFKSAKIAISDKPARTTSKPATPPQKPGKAPCPGPGHSSRSQPPSRLPGKPIGDANWMRPAQRNKSPIQSYPGRIPHNAKPDGVCKNAKVQGNQRISPQPFSPPSSKTRTSLHAPHKLTTRYPT